MVLFAGISTDKKAVDFRMGSSEGNGNIAELNRLEKDLLERKEKIKELDEPDETLSVLSGQLGAELGKLKKGKADKQALERAKELLSMVDDRLGEKGSPIKELQRRMKEKKEPMPEPEVDSGINELNAPETGLEEGEELDSDVKIVPDIDAFEESGGGEMEGQKRAMEKAGESVFGRGEGVEEGYVSPEELGKKEEKKEPKREETKEEKTGPKPTPEKKEPKPEKKPKKAEKPAEKEKPRPPKAGVAKTSSVDEKRATGLYESSIEQLLKAQLDNGAIIPCNANKQYVHIFPRDHGFAALALLGAGKHEEAKKALEFALKHQDKKEGNFPQRWDEAGSNTGYRGIPPDGTAMVLFAFAKYVLEKNNIDFAEKNWDKIEKAVDYLNSCLISDKNLVFSPSSIHEFPPDEKGYEIWTNALCCATFRELSKVAEKIRVEYEPLGKENLLKDSLMDYMWNSRSNSFVKTIKVKESSSVVTGPDASALALSFFDVFPPSDKRLAQTAKLVDEKLWHREYGGISRYAREEGRETGGFGASPFFTLLLADHFTKAGDKAKAEKYISWAINMSYDGLLPEHFATKDDFEGYVSDFSDAGLLNRDAMKLINKTRAHEDFKNGVAHITEPYTMAHAAFILVWNNFTEKFGK